MLIRLSFSVSSVLFASIWASSKFGCEDDAVRTKILLLLLFVDTVSKWEETVKSSGALLSPRQRSWLWLVKRLHPVRSGARWLAEAENFCPIRDAVTVPLRWDRGVNSQNPKLWQSHCMYCLTTKKSQKLLMCWGNYWEESGATHDDLRGIIRLFS